MPDLKYLSYLNTRPDMPCYHQILFHNEVKLIIVRTQSLFFFKAKPSQEMCDPITGKDDNCSPIYTLNILVYLEAEGNGNDLSVVL